MVSDNKKRISEQEKLYHYYVGSPDEVNSYLDTALAITFDSDDIQEFQRNWINITKKCINQLAIVYRDPASRHIVIDSNENKDLTDYYLSRLPLNINTIDKTAHRFAKLFNTSLTQAYFEDGKIKYNVLPSYLFDIKVSDNDPYKLTEVSYQKDFTVNGKRERFVVVWTDTEHYKVPLLEYKYGFFTGDKQPVVGEDIINPYGIIPFAVLRLEEQNDFWGVGLSDLVNMNEQINVMLTELINEQIIMGTAGTTLAVNLGLDYKKKDGTTGLKKVRTGRKHPIVVESADKEKATPSLEHVTTQPFIDEIRSTVDWHIKMIAMSKGLNPNSFLADVKATSGYSKVLDAMEQLEIRRDDIEPCRMYEDERFRVSVKINDYHATTTDKSEYGLKTIGDKAELVVDFAEITQQKTIDEIIKDTEYQLKYDLISVLDLMKEKNPDLVDDELKKKLDDNKAINDIYKPQVMPVNNNINATGVAKEIK